METRLKTRLKQSIINDRKSFGGIDPLKAVPFLTSKYTLLPELFDIFGNDVVLEFLQKFGGKTLKIPSYKSIEEALLHMSIFQDVNKDASPEAMKRLVLKHSMKEGEIRSAYKRVKGVVDGTTEENGTDPASESKETATDTTNHSTVNAEQNKSAYANNPDPYSTYSTGTLPDLYTGTLPS